MMVNEKIMHKSKVTGIYYCNKHESATCEECLNQLEEKARQEGYREGFNEALRPIREFLKLIGVEKLK